jgi:hypothetical protein
LLFTLLSDKYQDRPGENRKHPLQVAQLLLRYTNIVTAAS